MICAFWQWPVRSCPGDTEEGASQAATIAWAVVGSMLGCCCLVGLAALGFGYTGKSAHGSGDGAVSAAGKAQTQYCQQRLLTWALQGDLAGVVPSADGDHAQALGSWGIYHHTIAAGEVSRSTRDLLESCAFLHAGEARYAHEGPEDTRGGP